MSANEILKQSLNEIVTGKLSEKDFYNHIWPQIENKIDWNQDLVSFIEDGVRSQYPGFISFYDIMSVSMFHGVFRVPSLPSQPDLPSASGPLGSEMKVPHGLPNVRSSSPESCGIPSSPKLISQRGSEEEPDKPENSSSQLVFTGDEEKLLKEFDFGLLEKYRASSIITAQDIAYTVYVCSIAHKHYTKTNPEFRLRVFEFCDEVSRLYETQHR
jgi:hypothetical protein